MIKYRDVTTANFDNMQFTVLGDGVSKILVLNLAHPPFNINYNGVLPESFVVHGLEEGQSAVTSAILNGSLEAVLTITFGIAPELDDGTDTQTVMNISTSAIFASLV